jgi:hypothetical protein
MMKSPDQTITSKSLDLLEALNNEPKGYLSPIQHSKVLNPDPRLAACFFAIEVLLWQLVHAGILPAETLGDELERYARFHPDVAQSLRILARIARAAAPSNDREGCKNVP